MREDDEAIVESLVDTFWDELDNQSREGDLYVQPIDSIVDGVLNERALITAILEAYWEEYGR